MNGKIHRYHLDAAFEVIGLRSSRGRVVFFAAATIMIYLAPISLLAGLSLWQRLGIPSPSIGLTRAYHYFLHGDLHHAWQQNKIIYVILCLGLPIIIKDAYNTLKLISKRNSYGQSTVKQPRRSTTG
jgi:hypothetical protein